MLKPNTHAALIDPFGRTINYLRISLTDRCDLRCSYCLPPEGQDYEAPPDWLTFDEITQVVRSMASMGLRKVRLTGGEPLLRRNLPEVIAKIRAIQGIEQITLSTNATQLAKHAQALKDAGLTRLNISLDAIDANIVQQISGRNCLSAVLAGIHTAQAVGFEPIKINMVLLGGVNDTQALPLAEYCRTQGWILRIIETMPMGSTGQGSTYMPIASIRTQLVQHFNLHEVSNKQRSSDGPARYWMDKQGWKIGFITPISHEFCGSCNRIRMGVEGNIYLCLGQNEEVSLRPLLRQGASDAQICDALSHAVTHKPERHTFLENPTNIVRFMAKTGG
jgi:cyclic pyranopterin phosphate synthase